MLILKIWEIKSSISHINQEVILKQSNLFWKWKNNTATIYEGVKQLIKLKDSNRKVPYFISSNGKLFTNPKVIADTFNL